MKSRSLDLLFDYVQGTFDNLGFSPSPAAIIVTFFLILLPFLLLFILAIVQQEKPLPPPEGCRRLGLQGPSNLADQYAKKYSKGADASSSNPWKVKALFIYPVKSCAGVELVKSDVVRTGLKYDRQFTFGQYSTGLPSLEGKVDGRWNFISQRNVPRLAKVETEIWVPDASLPGYSPDGEWVKSEGCLVVRFPFTPDTGFSLEGLKTEGRIIAAKMAGKSEPMVEFRVPFNPSKEHIKKMKYKSEKIKVQLDIPEALNISSEIPEDVMAKLKYTLGVGNPLALFRIDTTKYREVFKNAPKKKDVGFQTIIGMQDSYPMHIQNLSSIHHVSSQLPRGYDSLNALRYRPNVLITGPPAFSEDDWTKARIGKKDYHISCRTTRCNLPNVDPETGIPDRSEPSKTMLKYRVIDKGAKSACLGMQVTPLTEGEIRVGDEVKVIETGEHFVLKA